MKTATTLTDWRTLTLHTGDEQDRPISPVQVRLAEYRRNPFFAKPLNVFTEPGLNLEALALLAQFRGDACISGYWLVDCDDDFSPADVDWSGFDEALATARQDDADND